MRPGPRPDHRGRPTGTATGVRLLDPGDDALRLPEAPGSYEWWNFFASDDSRGLTVSAIFLSANPWDVDYRKAVHLHRADPVATPAPDPLDFPLLQINVVRGGTKVFTTVALPPGVTTSFAEAAPEGRIGASTFTAGADGVWRVHLDHPDMTNWLRVKGDIEFRPGAPAFTVDGGGMWGAIPGGDLHQWNFPVPVPTTSGHIRVENRLGVMVLDTDIAGGGYTDHIWGEGLHDDVASAWHFGQAPLASGGKLVYVWVTPRDPEVEQYGRLILVRPGAVPEVREITSMDRDGQTRGKMGLAYHDTLTLHIAGGGSVTVRWRGNVEDWPFQVAGDAVFDIDIPGEALVTGVPGGAEYAWHEGIDDPLFRLLSSALDDVPWIP